MLIVYFLMKPVFWILPWLIQSASYWFILKKMGIRPFYAVLPIAAEERMAHKLLDRMRHFWRPVVVTLILICTGYYMGPYAGLGRVCMLAVFFIYGIMLMRMYFRLAKSFGKKWFFGLGTVLLPVVFLPILAVSKAEYTQLPLKPRKQHSKPVRILLRTGLILSSLVEAAFIIAVCGFIAIRTLTPAFLVNSLLNEADKSFAGVTDIGKVVTSEDALNGAEVPIKASRDYYFPDHSGDQNAVVMIYMIGSDLEHKNGFASANIRQMIEATSQGSGLKFILQTGGSGRWFTDGIKNNTVGRYEISDGKLKMLEQLANDTNMSEPENLSDFISWTAENCPADRYILALWDHGGGVASGFGLDQLNNPDEELLSVHEIATAVKDAGVTFDIIGFDACLMQDIEIAKSLSPYADYFLASEEIEGGYGWYYSYAFGNLAKDPGMSSKELGRQLIGCYDEYNTRVSDDASNSKYTLSFIDLSMIDSVYDLLGDFWTRCSAAVEEDPSAFAAVSIAANSAYSFSGDIQIDLIDFLQILDRTDLNSLISSHEETQEVINAVRSCILYRNGGSAFGINGISVAFPYKAIYQYTETSNQLSLLSLDEEKDALDRVFSIIAAQKNKALKNGDSSEAFTLMVYTVMGRDADFLNADWYIEGYENYDDSTIFVDIPLEEKENGYQIQLPDETWNTVADTKTIVYQQCSDVAGAVRRCLGSDYIGEDDGNGHPLVTMDQKWVHVNGILAGYESDPIRETDEGSVYSGRIKALLNGSQEIELFVEWDSELNADGYETARIINYQLNESCIDSVPDKGTYELKAGDRLQFLFDYYDEEGNLVATEPYGKTLRVAKPDSIKVVDSPLEPCTIEIGGILSDVYQRYMTTVMIEIPIE